MKIVVLDGYTLNPGDLCWSEFEKLGDVTMYDRTPNDLIIERASNAEILITNKTPLSANKISQLPSLKYIGVLATGYNIVDIEAAKERNIVVTNIPSYSTTSVSQFVFALLLELCHRTYEHSHRVLSGRWAESEDFCFWEYPLVELAGKTMGFVGFGKIGQQTANIAEAMGMNIIAYSRTKTDQSHRPNFKWVELEEVFSKSDVVSLHCPLFPETEGMVNKNLLNKMKKTAFFINTSRGGLIVEKDLADALNEGVIAGAGLDVLSKEPPMKDNPLLSAKNCFITPHIAWATKDARERLMNIAIHNVKAFLEGKELNVVNQ